MYLSHPSTWTDEKSWITSDSVFLAFHFPFIVYFIMVLIENDLHRNLCMYLYNDTIDRDTLEISFSNSFMVPKMFGVVKSYTKCWEFISNSE